MDIALQEPDYGLTRKQVNHILQRHGEIDAERLVRIHDSLTHEQSHFLRLLPLLLHLNHPMLPGFVSSETPAGIINYRPGRDTLLLAKRYVKNLREHNHASPRTPILGLYLIGSMGSLGQDNSSDLDIWLCRDAQLTPEQQASLLEKTQLLEKYAGKLKLPVHFFIMNAEEFRDGTHLQISDESSGDTQHYLLLEEFYRTALRLAGKPPLWWIVPPEQSENYSNYCNQLIEQHCIDEKDWLDFGGLQGITSCEFYTAAHWQLFKGIDSPYKSMLKLMLFEAYANQFPDIQWLSGDVKQLMHAEEEVSADQLDPYLLLMKRIEKYLSGPQNKNRLALARRAFYFKSGIKLSRTNSDNWQHQQMASLAREWGWDRGEFLILDSRAGWKLERTLEERNQLVAELIRSYQQLTEFASQLGKLEGINSSELALLGRKLYAALERHPGKVDCANPGISQDLVENEIWLRQDQQQEVWQLYLSNPNENPTTQKSALSLVEMLTWLHLNAIINTGTRIDVAQKKQQAIEPEQQRILKVLRKQLDNNCETSVALENFTGPPQGKLSIAFINIGDDDYSNGTTLTISTRSDPLSFGAKRQNLIFSIEHLTLDNWGEMRVHRHQGDEAILDMLCAHLNLFWQTQNPAAIHCHCFNSVHANAISTRLVDVTSSIGTWFQSRGEDARYILCIADDLYLVNRYRQQFNYTCIGDQTALLEYLMQAEDTFKPLVIDQKSLPGSPLPLIFRLNQENRVQVFYHVTHGGIKFYVLDDLGALYEQWLPQAKEQHFLIQQQRFFDTLQNWRSLALTQGQPPGEEVIFCRLQTNGDSWHAETVKAPRTKSKHYVELILNTGRHGPWRDGFSLTSGSHEFNSLQLGDSLYSKVASHLLGMRRNNETYPIYLTGVVAANAQAGIPIPIVELLRFKGAVERRLACAINPD